MKLFFDTETSGLPLWNLPSEDSNQPFLVEFAAILEDDDGKDRGFFHCVVQPPLGCSIPDDVSAIHGITTEIANKFGVPLIFVVDYFRNAVRMVEGNLVAHNVKFDVRMMKISLLQISNVRSVDKDEVNGFMLGLKPFCTMTAATPIVNLPPTEKMLAAGFRKPKSPTLGECYRHFFGEELAGAHGALADAKACREVYRAILREKEKGTL